MASEPLVDVEDQYDGYDHEEEEELRSEHSARRS